MCNSSRHVRPGNYQTTPTSGSPSSPETSKARRVKMKAFDAIIIGTGQSGPSLAHRLAGAGMRVAIIERYRFGGTCVNTGCTPTKTLVASAYVAHVARRAREYGIMIDGAIGVDMKKVRQRKDYVLGFSTR